MDLNRITSTKLQKLTQQTLQGNFKSTVQTMREEKAKGHHHTQKKEVLVKQQ